MVKEVLVSKLYKNQIIEGRKLILRLDKLRKNIEGAFWFLNPEYNNWELYLVTKSIRTIGPMELYYIILDCIEEDNLEIKLGEVKLITSDKLIVSALRDYVKPLNKARNKEASLNKRIQFFYDLMDANISVFVYRLPEKI